MRRKRIGSSEQWGRAHGVRRGAQVYARKIETLGANTPKTDGFASRDAPQLRKCRRGTDIPV